MSTALNTIRATLQAQGVPFREFNPEPGKLQLLILCGAVTTGLAGVKGYSRVVVVDYCEGKWVVGPPSGDQSFEPAFFPSEDAALEATLAEIGRDA